MCGGGGEYPNHYSFASTSLVAHSNKKTVRLEHLCPLLLWKLFQKELDRQLGFTESILTRYSTWGKGIKSIEVCYLYISIFVIHISSAIQLDLILIIVNETAANVTSKTVLGFEALIPAFAAVTI